MSCCGKYAACAESFVERDPEHRRAKNRNRHQPHPGDDHEMRALRAPIELRHGPGPCVGNLKGADAAPAESRRDVEANARDHSAVVGSICERMRATEFAGKPACSACLRMSSASGAR